MRIPATYEDLLPVGKSAYNDVPWEESKAPRSNAFSVKQLLDEEESRILQREVQVAMDNIVKGFSDLSRGMP